MFKKNKIMRFKVLHPCVQGYLAREFETEEEAKECLDRLMEKPRIEEINENTTNN
jgi:hypothetical protein